MLPPVDRNKPVSKRDSWQAVLQQCCRKKTFANSQCLATFATHQVLDGQEKQIKPQKKEAAMFTVIKDTLADCEFNALDTYLIEAVATIRDNK